MTELDARLPANGTRSGKSEREDARLVAACACGDAAAFQALHARFHVRVHVLAQRILGQADRADEVTNDTMLAVWCSASRFEGRSRVSTWIDGIAYRKALKTRRRFRFEEQHVEIDAAQYMQCDRTESFARRFEQRQVSAALGRLSADLRSIVELSYRDGLSYADIAEIVCCPVGTVKSRMSRARRLLRDEIALAQPPLPSEIPK
ncbi:MAG: RNA polymerase sigma factor [Pseudomonadota bacterium]